MSALAKVMAPPPPNPIHGQLLQAALARPLFSQEGPQNYAAAYAHNAAFAKPGPYQTQLAPKLEDLFRNWVTQQHIPFDPNAKTVDYDMRGFFAQNPNDTHAQGAHFPDTFKTPYDTTFSNQSEYAQPGTPFVWRGNTLVDSRTGQTISR